MRMIHPAGILTLSLLLLFPALAKADETTDRARRRSPVVEVFEQCRDAVVNISTTRIQEMRTPRGGSLFEEIFGPRYSPPMAINSVGSGQIVHESGYIVTNAHVVARTTDITVTFADGSTAPAALVATDPQHDLAVLKVNADRKLPHLTLGRSDDIMVGETVIAIGNPLGLQHTVTSGIVSALNRELRFSEDMVYSGLIQSDAAINPGNSGGPLLNVNGELIGINTAIRGDAQNVGFAIPVDRLWALLPSLLNIEGLQRVRFGLEVGGHEPVISEVLPGSPAQKAGLSRNDRILAINDAPVRDGIDFYARLRTYKPGDTIQLQVEQRGKSQTVRVPLEVIPPPDGRQLSLDRLGLKLIEVTPALRRKYDLPGNVGLIVDEVIRDSTSDQAGVVPGDILLRVNGAPVRSIDELGLALEETNRGDRVFLEGARIHARPPFQWQVQRRAD